MTLNLQARKNKINGVFTLPVCRNIQLLILFVWGLQAGAMAQSTITLDSVSVNPANQIVLGWTLQSIANEGYTEIHRQLGNGLYAPIIQIPISQTYFVDSGVDAGNQAWSYYVVARHPNGDIIAVSNEAHRNIFQEIPQYFVCEKLITLSWINYFVTTSSGTPQPLPNPFDLSSVWISFNDGPFEQQLSFSNQTERLLINAAHAGRYCIKVWGHQIQGTKTVSSNIRCLEVLPASSPLPPELRQLTLDEPSQSVILNLKVDPAVPDASYAVLLYDPQSQEYNSLETIYPVGNQIQFTLGNTLANQRPETFMVHTLDSCGAKISASGPWSTIHVVATPISLSENMLQWNDYTGWQNGVAEYMILRRMGNQEPFLPLASIAPGFNIFTDDLTFAGQNGSTQNIAYRVMAIENSGAFIPDTVLSNIAEIEYNVGVFIPNAFNPQSQIEKNRLFKPEFLTSEPTLYQLFVFNRWGQEVFTSKDPDYGWDGRVNGQQAPAGVYTYTLVYEDSSGKKYRKTGGVILMY